MSKKLSITEINEKLFERGIEIVGDYVNSRTKTEFRCHLNHTWSACPAFVIHGNGCPHCAGNAGLTKDIVNDRIKDTGIRMIGEYITSKTNSEFICQYNHTWLAKPNNILSGNRCPHCARQFRLSKELVNERIEHRGLKLVGEYTNNKTRTEFECSHGHKWLSRTDDILNGHGCPYCAERGYSPSKPGWIYILIYSNFIKYGITNYLDDRLSQHRTVGPYTIALTRLYEDGTIAKNLERDISLSFGGRFVTKDIMPDGYTETLCVSKLDKVIELLSSK